MSSKSTEHIGQDGLPLLVEGDWSKLKFELVERYATAFNKAIQKKFVHRAYIDLFAGTGLVAIKDSDEEAEGCALRAIEAKPAFTQFVFCDSNPRYLASLSSRILQRFPNHFGSCKFFEGDCNDQVDSILAALPRPNRSNTFLGFCLVDPFGASGFKFETIRQLARFKMDFLVLVPTGMDFRRNKNVLLENPKLADDFLGQKTWRSEWALGPNVGKDFGIFMLDQFGQSMRKLGFKYNGPEESFPVKYPVKNVMLYHMAFFSKSDLGAKLFKECKKYMTAQQSFL